MVRPLTKHDKTGNLYIRPHRVEAQINTILSQGPAPLRHHLAIADPQSPDYLHSECLVHIIRDARRNSDKAILNAAFPVLLARCKVILLAKIPDTALRTAVDVREEVLGQFSELFATDGTEENRDYLDCFECRFNLAFRAFYIDLVRSEKARLKQLVPLPDYADDIEHSRPYKEIPTRLIEALRRQEAAEDSVLLREVYEAIDTLPDDERKAAILCRVMEYKREVYEAIDTLPDDERKAVILCHVMEYKIESNNPDETTAATICNVTGRTIHNRLSRAAEKLSHLKET